MMTMNTRCRLAAAAAVLAALAGCGGGGSDGPTALAAAADTLTLGTGQSASVLDNDKVGGAAASSANATVSFTGTLPAGVSAAGGALSVARGAVPGTYTLAYQLCETAAPGNCTTGTATLTVARPPIVASADTASLGRGETASLLGNDLLDGVAATASTVTASTTGTWPAGVSLGGDGVLTISGTAALGTATLAYRICQTAATTNCADSSVNLSVVSRLAISGRVVDGVSGVAVVDATVAQGGLTTRTDEQGRFNLVGVVPTARAVVVVTGAGYSENARIVTIGENGASDVLTRLAPRTLTATVDPATGGTVADPHGPARVVFAAGSLIRTDGRPLTGQATVTLSAIDPALDATLMPGDYTTLVGGNPVPIESFGALSVQITDAADQPVNLRAGHTATLRIPLRTRSAQAPATIPLFYFDMTSGHWVQEGSATLQGSGADRYYEGTVSHFSVWNADRITDTVWVNGCVTDAAGTSVAGARISSDGIDYSGTSSAVSDAAGAFRIALRRNSTATLTGVSGTLLTNTLRVSSGPADRTLPNCLVLAANANGVSIKLTWGERPSDLDSHLWTPGGDHIDFRNQGNLAAAPFANLDVDDTDSFGPEVMTITRLMVGTYRYAVRNYSGFTLGSIIDSRARVELTLPGGRNEFFAPPPAGENQLTTYWTLFELVVDAQCNITVRRTEAFIVDEPTAPPSATPVYCTRP